LNGVGTAKNEKEAFYWFKSASESGSFGGSYDLGNAYEHGIGTSVNLDKAYEAYSKVHHKNAGDTYTKIVLDKAKERYHYFRENSVCKLAHFEYRKMYLKLIPENENTFNDTIFLFQK
jgi:TPR repeat protein